MSERRGERCLLLIIGNGKGPRNCLMQFESDGGRMIVSWGVLKNV